MRVSAAHEEVSLSQGYESLAPLWRAGTLLNIQLGQIMQFLET